MSIAEFHTEAAERESGDVMMWHVQYRKNAAHHIVWHPSPERAIEGACGLLDEGCDVYGIGTGPLTDSIEKDVIAKIYAIWVRAKYPFGLISS
jgi:hypothetical protein